MGKGGGKERGVLNLPIDLLMFKLCIKKQTSTPKSLEAWILYLVEATALSINCVLNIENHVKVEPVKECIVKDDTVPSWPPCAWQVW